MASPDDVDPVRVRRAPPPFRHVEVAEVRRRSPYLVQLTLAGPDLRGMEPPQAGASIRLLLPDDASGVVELPTWTGNEFLAADGSRPSIRTLTPLRLDITASTLDVEVVLHGPAPLSTWAEGATPGAAAALSGPGRGYEPDPDAPSFLVVGDESAVPGISTVLPVLAVSARVVIVIEARDAKAHVSLPADAGRDVTWLDATPGAPPGDALVGFVTALEVEPSTRVWAAGEAAAMQRLRKHLFDQVGLPRAQAVVRGYWKEGRAGGD